MASPAPTWHTGRTRWHIMRRHATWAGGLVLGLGLVFAGGQRAEALIKDLMPLSRVLAEHNFILTATVETLDPKKPGMVLTVEDDLKDKAPFRRLPVYLKGDQYAADNKHTELLLNRLAPKQSLVLFVNQRGKKFVAFAYTNGTWFQMTGEDEPVRWALVHGEPYLRRTFKGTTAELKQVIVDGLAGKTKPPEPNEKEEPGFGPEVKPEEKQDKPPEEGRLPGSFASGALFAVIPTGAIGGLLAILALFFPALFGGLALAMRRWVAAMSVLSINSTLFCLYVWLRPSFPPEWWNSPLALWTVMTAVTVLGIVWSWQRHLGAVAQNNGNGSSAYPVPGRAELIVLAVASLLGVVMVAWCLVAQWSLFDDSWSKPLMVMWVGFWTATLYALFQSVSARRGRAGRSPLPAEGVLLGAVGLASLVLGVMTMRPPPVSAGDTQTRVDDEGGGAEAAGAQPVGVAWKWEAAEKGGVVYSSPAVDGDRVYAAAAHQRGFDTYGRIYCLDRGTGRQVWSFDDDGDMKQVFSSPRVVGGKVYVGEGFHQDHDCKMYCLDAATGVKLWSFATRSHTESSPCVVDGKVYFGAGDDGVFCLNADDGKMAWHYEKLHVDSNPAVVDGKVYAGSGVGDVYRETCMFALDAGTGKELWRLPPHLPVWGSPTVAGQHVCFGLGNGDFTRSADKPAGAVMCLEAATGKRIWRVDVPDGVLDRPAIDRHRVYFGSRDGCLYCVSRKDGTSLWKKDLGSPVVASVALARQPGTGAASVYALGSGGKLYCFDPETGREDYTFDVLKDTQGKPPELYSSMVVVMSADGQGTRRQILFGAGVNNFVTKAAVVYCYEDRWPGP